MVANSDKLKRAARAFLRTGKVSATHAADLAEECNRLVRAETQRSIKTAIDLGRSFVKFTRRRKDMPLQLALRSYGWALHMGGRYRQAEKVYLEARSCAINDFVVRGRIDRILVDVYMYRGDFDEAHRRARLSLETFRRHGAEEDVAKSRVNYANLFHRQDRHREAGQQYKKAAEYFESHGGNLSLAICTYNQANTLVQLFDFDQAEQLYTKAADKFDELGFDLYVNECRYGMAWLYMLRGDYHVALQKLAACEETYRKAGQPKGEMLCQMDRAEAFLGLNLFSDALSAARSAESKARKLGVEYESSKAAFFFAISSTALGKDREAREALVRAEEGFAREHNRAFVSAVQMFSAQTSAEGASSPSELSVIRQHFSKAQLPLWEAICDLQLWSHWPGDSAAKRRLGRNPAVKAVPHLYSQWQTQLGDREADRGRMAVATEHWARAAEVLDAVRAKLPPVELRANFMPRRTDPYLRLISQDVGIDPARAAVWSERHKTAGVWTSGGGDFGDHVVRRKVESGLAELAERVTALSRRITGGRGKRSAGVSQSETALQKLQQRVQHDLAVLEKHHETRDDLFQGLLNDIQTVSRRQPVIQFHYDKDDLIAFVHEQGETRSHRFKSGWTRVNEFMGCWSILLGRNLLSRVRRRSSDVSEERDLFAELGVWLWSPLEVSSTSDRILILPEGRMANLPWMAVVHDGLPLATRHCITLSPSLRHHMYASGQRVRSNRIEVFVGKQDGLSQNGEEYAALTGCSGRDVTVHLPCERADWLSNGGAWIWHYTGHAHFRCDNPFYSSLSLADGPLFAADFRVKHNRVGLVTLAACRTGNQSVLPGEESTGLVRSLLEMGARNVVGSHWNVSDKSTALWMSEFYNQILDNKRVGTAMRHAHLCVRETYPSAYDWAAFSVFGAG